MRKAISKHIDQVMQEDEDIIVLLGDLGFGIFDTLRLKYPERIINCGIAEQNMIGVASGLALGGKKPVVYSIAPFVTSRVLEQIKIDLCQQNVNVTIIGTGAGFAYGNLGPTHHCLEDFASLTCLPNLHFLQPFDQNSSVECLKKALRNDGPSYIRLTADGVDLSSFISERREITKDVLILATGGIAKDCVDVARKIKAEVRFITELNYIHCEEAAKQKTDFIGQFHQVFTIEESYLRGGFGSSIAELISDHGLKVKLTRIGVKSKFPRYGGTSDEIREQMGIGKNNIEYSILDTLGFLEE